MKAKSFNVITGLPRSGSTLLCNILNQNPKFHASSTSALCQTLATVTNIWGASAEIKSDLADNKEATDKRMKDVLAGIVKSWYSDKEVVFDKSRGWMHNHMLLRSIFPESKIIVCVRDLRDVFASVEKQYSKNPWVDDSPGPIAKTVFARADYMFGPQGLIGQPINGVEELLRRNPKGVVVVQYEQFSKAPKLVMERIYSELRMDYFEHDFKDVKNTSTDLDALYLNKFPHEGSGEVKPAESQWEEFVPKDVADLIMNKFNGYNQVFGYVR